MRLHKLFVSVLLQLTVVSRNYWSFLQNSNAVSRTSWRICNYIYTEYEAQWFMDYKSLQMWIENIGFCKKPSIGFSLLMLRKLLRTLLLVFEKTVICCKLHYLNLFKNHLKFNQFWLFHNNIVCFVCFCLL